ncbi:MAG: SAM-dependent methyltransferase [bacterium TMED88]|nr:SAM-dependent methyltransferase [Deltaproteobacteria bacterium]OUV34787.1 MAG: SAM-dependent methyltransferase [bacterium TMED88]
MREDQRRFAPAATRNREAICQALKNEWPAQGKVLEIASGSGEHAVFLARHAPHLQFQPSDPDPEARASIEAWQVHEGLESVAPPLSIDVREPDWADSISQFEALLCINMIHIAPWSASEGLFKGSKAVLAPKGLLYLYGPFQRGGLHTAKSNAAFDESLRERNPEWGVRDLEAVEDLATRSGLALQKVIEMPANNLSLIFRGQSPD